MRRGKNILIFGFWLILMVPLIQMNTGWIPDRGLKGGQDPASWPGFSIKNWFSGDFQNGFNQAFEEHIGCRSLLIRYRNQIEYSIFRKANASGVIVGKKNSLFEKDYIRAWQGTDYLGDRFWNQKFTRLKMVSDTLMKTGRHLLLILEPGKASYYPELIPARYQQSDRPSANYNEILLQADKFDIPILDLNRYFMDLKESTPVPLFPRGGIHWSFSGMLASVDSIAGFIHEETGIPMKRIKVSDAPLTKNLKGTDDDLAQIMNLAFKPGVLPMAYPDWEVTSSDTLQKPRVLSISDSFYFSIINNGLDSSLFSNRAFWYYNKTIYPETWEKETLTDDIDFQAEVERMDVILIMVTERFYYKFDWEFIDRLFEIYFPGSEPDYLYDYFRMIIRNYQWFDDIYAEAQDLNAPFIDRLTGHAGYQFWVDDQKKPFPRNRAYFTMKILTDPSWMQQITEKAMTNNIPVEEQIKGDAQWMASQDSL